MATTGSAAAATTSPRRRSGFPALCPGVTIPGGTACGGVITDLQSLVDCVDCVTEFAADCSDRVRLPLLTSYPSECGVCALPASGPCPTGLTFTADGPAVDLDTGFSGLTHNANVPTNGKLTLAVSGCAGASQPTCGECTVTGPLPNSGGITFDNQRCSDATWIPCDGNGDCTTAGATGPCVFFFGAPLPLVAGGVSTCVVNEINGPVSGTINLDDGTSSTHIPLRSHVHFVGTPLHPCPICKSDGTCNGGSRATLPCSTQGTGIHGDVTLDCPPDNLTGTLTIDLALTTGTQTRTLTTANPVCSALPGTRCFCDTCNNANQEACGTNADCPISGGNPGICGGRRCLGGTNAGGPCSGSSTPCPGGVCGRPGEPTLPNPCNDDSIQPGDGSICHDSGDGQGMCPEGPSHPALLDRDLPLLPARRGVQSDHGRRHVHGRLRERSDSACRDPASASPPTAISMTP